ncbi:MAG: glycine--tRNA ligase subunit beta [Desulfobacterales bacterium]|nr:glycine--tRNA ligase subunit beta [Desulfobacterales bacterium]
METLLLEIGTEEIPAGYIEPALEALSTLLVQKLDGARIAHGSCRTYGTPRRLAVEVSQVSQRQPPLTTQILGPPERIGFDASGNPTLAAQKFAEKAGVPVSCLKISETKKGAYLCADQSEAGKASMVLLKNILPQVVSAIPFPKTMRWSDLNLQFARPVHSILALYGRRIIPFRMGNVKSGRYVQGHHLMCPGRIRIAEPSGYVDQLRRASVFADIQERKQIVARETAEKAKALGGKILPDNELVHIVSHLVECPSVVAGQFDKSFLDLPDEILITAMREHQKYFAVLDSHDKLMPDFIAVSNTSARDMNLVAKGHERVLRARLADAKFFYESDLKISFETRLEQLKGVLFQAKLGSLYDKTLRVQKLVEYATDMLGADMPGPASSIKSKASRAATLCKADLVCNVVGEFPKLQGTMGRIYAGIIGEPADVAAAIEEHYLPNYSGGPLPGTLAGAMVGIADKVDNICGCFHAGLIPSGASDPYALRRQGIGIVQIMLDKGFSFSLAPVIQKSLELYGDAACLTREDTQAKVAAFLKQRIAHLLMEEGFSKDVVSAVIDVSTDPVPDVWHRVRALEKLKTKPDFSPLATAFKRIVNIIKQADPVEGGDGFGPVAENRFQHESESALYQTYGKISGNVEKYLAVGQFDRALMDIASLKDSVDAFFESVLVMSEDAALRRNRLALLARIAALFGQIADFSKIST